MAPVAAALRTYAPKVETRVALTGQHTTLVDQVLTAFDLDRHYDLGIMKEEQTLYDLVHGAVDGLREVVTEFRPDIILVQGDTATVFTAALVGFFERVSVGHVEAGLRSGDKNAPFPEEVFRRLTDVISDFYFAPTGRSRDLLLAENVPADAIYVTGNTVVDALIEVGAQNRPITNEQLRSVVLDTSRRLVLLTAHRRESFGAPMRELFAGVRSLADQVEDIEIVYPVHPNPNVLEPASELLSGHPRIHLTEPLDYFDLVAALRAASLVLTDSGGIQEEAPTFGTPVLVLREVTERPEGIDAGVAELVGTDATKLIARGLQALSADGGSCASNPYGDGRAGKRIADIVVSSLTGVARSTQDWNQ
jgi:UDP-N-acetylglucosamine 2-epimerase (non-hydrolysing)